MKCYNIKVHAEIPIHTFIDQTGESPYLYFRDGNLSSYSIQSVREACENVSNLPIIKRDNLGLGEIIGFSYTINIQHLLSLVKLLNPRRIHRNVRL